MAIVMISLSLTGGVAFAMTPTPQDEPKAQAAEVIKEAPKEEVKPTEPAPVEREIVETQPTETPTPVVAPSASGVENVIWKHFIDNGYTREQTAGIMGNLQQEHNFNTDGDGLAQWIDGRKARLQSIPNSDTLTVQLNYIIYELSTTHSAARNAVKASTTVEGATIAFQNLYEGCGDCRQSQRIQYAYDILGRH